MQKIVLILLAITVLMFMGCSNKEIRSYTPPAEVQFANSAVFNYPADKVKNAAIQYLKRQYSQVELVNLIDNPASQSLVVYFLEPDPQKYIDCGVIQISLSSPSIYIPNGTHTFNAAQQRNEHPMLEPGSTHVTLAVRTTQLKGKVTLAFTEESKNSTYCTVTIQYTMPVRVEYPGLVKVFDIGIYGRVEYVQRVNNALVTFNTGETGTLNDGSETICVTKYILEKSIIDGIKAELTI